MYTTLLFDVDNTLLDFDANERASFKQLLQDKNELCSDERYTAYKNLNRSMWQTVERGQAIAAEILPTRFSRFMALYGKEIDGAEWEASYRAYLNEGIQEIPDVHEVLSVLRKNHRLYVITNGVPLTQYSRLSRSGIGLYFEASFISGEIGAAKPKKLFFDYVKSHIDGFDRKKTLIIGDSLSSDIKGGLNAGIDTCWFCPGKTPNKTQIFPKYTIHALKDLFTLLKVNVC